MKGYMKGIGTGVLFCISVMVLIGAVNNRSEVGRYDYYISTDDITKRHYSRIFDTATGVVYHKQFNPGGEQTNIKWVNGERIEKRHFRPDLSIWKSESWREYQRSYEENRNSEK